MRAIGHRISTTLLSAKPSLPSAPTGLAVTSFDDRSVELFWFPPNSNGSSITRYLIESSRDDGETWQSGELLPGTDYLFRVSAVNAVGRGPASEAIRQKTAHEETLTLTHSGNWNPDSVPGFLGTSLRRVECWAGERSSKQENVPVARGSNVPVVIGTSTSFGRVQVRGVAAGKRGVVRLTYLVE